MNLKDLRSTLSSIVTLAKAVVGDSEPEKLNLKTDISGPVLEDSKPTHVIEPQFFMVANLFKVRGKTAIQFTSKITDIPPSVLFTEPMPQNEAEMTDRLCDIVTGYLNDIYFNAISKPITSQEIEQWMTSSPASMYPSLLWLLMYKVENRKKIESYASQLRRLHKEKKICEFKDLPDQRDRLN